MRDELARYADEAVDWGKGLGTALAGAFRSAEDALAGFVAGGTLSYTTSGDMIAPPAWYYRSSLSRVTR